MYPKHRLVRIGLHCGTEIVALKRLRTLLGHDMAVHEWRILVSTALSPPALIVAAV